MTFKKILILLSCFTIVSCKLSNVNVDVSYTNYNQKGVLIMDGKTKFNLPADSLSISISIPEGVHKFKLNNEKEFECNITEDGGILNLNNLRFVSITEAYRSTDFLGANKSYINCIVIDSIVYVIKEDSTAVINDIDIKNKLEELKTNNYYDAPRLYESKKFIPKDWDYGLNEDFPTEIETYGRNASDDLATEIKRKVIPLSLFKLFPIVSPSMVETKHLKDVLALKNDKANQFDKKNNQMKMD